MSGGQGRCDSVLVRRASDDFWAMKIANVMQSFDGVEVISIVYQPTGLRSSWCVFAKFSQKVVSIDEIDKAIDREHQQ